MIAVNIIYELPVIDRRFIVAAAEAYRYAETCRKLRYGPFINIFIIKNEEDQTIVFESAREQIISGNANTDFSKKCQCGCLVLFQTPDGVFQVQIGAKSQRNSIQTIRQEGTLTN